MLSKAVFNYFIRNKWFTQPVVVKPDSILCKFLHIDWNSRNEPAHYSFNCIDWNAPYSKKSKNMINAESVKIITHLFKSLTPPFKMVLLHFLPVISWETPILTLHCKIIRWRSRLLIHVK